MSKMCVKTTKRAKEINIYTLTLSEEQAALIKCLLRHVGGPTHTSPRGIADIILANLIEVPYIDIKNILDNSTHYNRNTIPFKPDSLETFEQLVQEVSTNDAP